MEFKIGRHMKILIVNGPNLNLLGKREPHIYGSRTFQSYFDELQAKYTGHTLRHVQSNCEGGIIECSARSSLRLGRRMPCRRCHTQRRSIHTLFCSHSRRHSGHSAAPGDRGAHIQCARTRRIPAPFRNSSRMPGYNCRFRP